MRRCGYHGAVKPRTCTLAVLLVAGLLIVHVGAAADSKIPRIGFLGSSGDRAKARLASLDKALREQGYVDGKTVLIEQRYAGGDFDKLPALAADLVRLNVDLIVTEGAPAAQAAKRATDTIPIVMGNAADPVGTGLVASLTRPGANVTGLSDFNQAVVAKRLELLRDITGSLSRAAVLWNPTNPTNPLQLKEVETAARAMRIALLPLAAKSPADIDRAFDAMRKERTEALLVLGDPMLGTHRHKMAELAAKARIPAIYGTSEHVDAGGLVSYGTNFDDLYRRAATYVVRILKGARPADLPVEQPTTFELVINLKAAQRIGLTIPPSIVYRADRVVQ
jgi:putative ABC transport system substrate-binding protein